MSDVVAYQYAEGEPLATSVSRSVRVDVLAALFSIARMLLKQGGRSMVVVGSKVASLAAASAASFPGMLEWLDSQTRVTW